MKSFRYITAQAAVVTLAIAPSYATDYLQIEDAQKITFPNAKEFKEAHVVFTSEQKKLIEEESGIPVTSRAQKVWQVFSSGTNESEEGTLIGWFVVDYVIGKHNLIDYAVAIDINKKVLDVEILSYRESYGGEIRSRNWRTQFVGKGITDSLTLNEDINNIGGATLSSRHVTEGIKRILATLNVTQQHAIKK